MAAPPSSTALCGGGQTLDDAVAGQHAPVDGKVAADHERTHGSVFLGQPIRLVRQIGLVLASVDKDVAREAIYVAVTFVGGVRPSTAAAEAFQVLHIKTSHCETRFTQSPFAM